MTSSNQSGSLIIKIAVLSGLVIGIYLGFAYLKSSAPYNQTSRKIVSTIFPVSKQMRLLRQQVDGLSSASPIIQSENDDGCWDGFFGYYCNRHLIAYYQPDGILPEIRDKLKNQKWEFVYDNNNESGGVEEFYKKQAEERLCLKLAKGIRSTYPQYTSLYIATLEEGWCNQFWE